METLVGYGSMYILSFFIFDHATKEMEKEI